MNLFTPVLYFFRKYVWAILSALLVMLLTVFSYQEAKRITRERNEKIFEARTEQVRTVVSRRMHHYIQILKGAQSFYVSSDTVTRADWRTYIANLEVDKNYPGIQGIGFAPYLQREQLPELVQRVRAEGFPDFKITPAGKRPVYTPIIYLEPFTGSNLRAFGFDMFSEQRRRKAIQKAIDTNLPAITSKLILVQETNQNIQYGFLLYLPVYADKQLSGLSSSDRRQRIRGLIYAPFRIQDLMTAILNRDFTNVTITLYDGSRKSAEGIFYSNSTGNTTTQNKYYQNNGFYKQLPLTIGGHTWLLEVKANTYFHALEDSDRPILILMSGITISLLVFFMGLTLSGSRYTNELKQLITDHISAAIFMVDEQNRCTFINPAAEKMTGYTFAELKGKSVHDAIHYLHPDGSPFPRQDCTMVQALLTKTPLTPHEEWFIRKDGSFYPVVCSASSVLEGNTGLSVLIEVRDITEERNARLAIEESEARFRIMADSAPVIIYVNDPAGYCQYLNKQWVAFTGQSLEEGQGKGWQEMIHPDDRPQMSKAYFQAFGNKEPFQTEYRLKNKQDTYASVVSSATPRFNAAGIFQGYIGSIVDITEIKEAERRIKENAALLQKVFHNVPAIVGLIRASDRRYILANPKMLEINGDRPLVGLTLREAHANLHRQSLFELVEKVIATGEPFVGDDVPIAVDRYGTGEFILNYFNLVYQPTFDLDGSVETVLVFAVEVTELVSNRKALREMNEELTLKNEQLLRINNDLDNFVYTASHDLKAPIANLEGLIRLLKGNLAPLLKADDELLLQYIGKTITKLRQTITDLTDITKVQKAIQEPPEPLAFEQILKDVQEDIRTLIEDSGARIYTDFKVPEIKYERKNLRSIVYNLLSNAIKYRDPQRVPEVIIKTRRVETGIELTFEDNGLGIENNKLHKLFAMFQRLHSHVEGSGIGLYIVKRIIENNGGTIRVQSELGQGTTFTVLFPDVMPAIKETATITF